MNLNPFSQHFILVAPLLNLLIWFYHYIPDIGVVIILLTLLIRIILAPSFHKSLKNQKALNDLQPKLNDLREKHKDNKEAQAKAMMELYGEHKISPFSSCLPLLIQLPLLIALYQVFTKALNGQLTELYSFVPRPEFVNPHFLGLIDLSQKSSASAAGIILAVIAGLAQFWQSKLTMPKNSTNTDPTAKMMQMQTTYILPALSVFFALSLPAGLPLYWIVTTFFAIAQQYWIMKKTHPQTV
ncbi:MAG: membrane protein insertase YidC [Candidatus Doudnabacteria bacterium]|nr:membrane protein insertase YidC [Candidatus Doudnabacteria bacterium]